jgi:hypothetical protein
LLIGAVASLLLSAAYRFLPLPVWLLYLATAAPAAGALAGFLFGGWRRAPLLETARWVDQSENLKERLSTALETSGYGLVQPPLAPENRREWRDLLVKDAASTADRLDPRRVIAFRVAAAGRWAALVLLLGAVLGFVPEYRTKEHLRKQQEAENIRETGRRLAEMTRRAMEQERPKLEVARTALEETAVLGDRLAVTAPGRDEALRELSNAAERLRQAAAELSRSPAARMMQQAARASGGELKSPGALQKETEALREQLGGASSTPEQLRQVQNQLRSAEQAARAMAGTNASAADLRDQLGTALSDLSSQAHGLGLSLPQLDEAIQALAADQAALFLKNLEASLLDLEKLAQMARALEAMRQQAGKLGKDLAEQLANGQAEAARETLQNLAAKLRSGNLPAEDLKKVIEEIGKAMGPAGNYGEVAKHLQAAAELMQKGAQPGAGESLTQAADELERLMNQVGDAQAVLSAMDALREASMCLGTGRLWAPGRAAAKRPGAMAGAGVGTWSDAQQEWDGAVSPMPDNLDFQRPDEDSRSGPGEAEQATGLTSTRVRGQFSPGGQMPSISLRGVGIKGQSTAAYEEAAIAAQMEAESALGQDKVPRAYRDAVRNYFDDLKH